MSLAPVCKLPDDTAGFQSITLAEYPGACDLHDRWRGIASSIPQLG